jgi:hypothetical protein
MAEGANARQRGRGRRSWRSGSRRLLSEGGAGAQDEGYGRGNGEGCVTDFHGD